MLVLFVFVFENAREVMFWAMYDLGLVLQRPSKSDLPTLVDSFTLDGHGACIVKVCGRDVVVDPGRFVTVKGLCAPVNSGRRG